MHSPSSQEFLIQWRRERALRVGRVFGLGGIALVSLTTVVDLYSGNISLVLADLLLMAGCAFTYWKAKSKHPGPFFWLPLFLSFFLACLPTYWMSGGLNSPFFGIGIALLYVIGEVLDSKDRSFLYISLAFAHIPIFYLIEKFHPLSGSPQMSELNAVIIALNLAGISVCMRAFLRTESSLSLEFSARQRELSNSSLLLEKRVEERTMQLEQSLEREVVAKEQAEKAAQTKMQFLANMSHEIRTPLNSILGFSDILASENLSQEEIRDYLGRVRANGKQLLHLIDDILDLSRFEAGQIPLQLTNVDPRMLIQKTVQSFHPASQRKNLKFHLHIDENLPPVVQMDESRTQQILDNLIGNAVKFSDSGTITISLGIQGQKMIISIEDTGIGIAEKDQKNLFQIFSQADGSYNRRFSGSGLGLAISKRIAEAMQGTLELEWSQPGRGSCFQLELPL